MRFILQIFPDGRTTMTSRAKSVKTFRFSELDGKVLGLLDVKSPFETGVTILDGEILCPLSEIELPSGVKTTTTLQSTVALMHMNTPQSLKMQEKYGSLVFNCFDILKLDGDETKDLTLRRKSSLGCINCI